MSRPRPETFETRPRRAGFQPPGPGETLSVANFWLRAFARIAGSMPAAARKPKAKASAEPRAEDPALPETLPLPKHRGVVLARQNTLRVY